MTRQEIMAVVKTAVCTQLKSPASAQFPDDLGRVSKLKRLKEIE